MKKLALLSLSLFLILNLISCQKSDNNNIPVKKVKRKVYKTLNKEDANRQLILASQSGNLEQIKEAIANKADIDLINKNDVSCPCSPITYAATNGHLEVVKELIKAGANPNAEEYSWSPLIASIAGKHTDITRELIDAGAEVNIYEQEGATPLMYAVRQNDIETVGILIAEGANVNTKDFYGKTALMQATDEEIQNLLIERGADRSDILYFPLLNACKENDTFKIIQLIEDGANANVKNYEDGKTALIYAVEQNNTEIAKLLLDHGAKLDEPDYNNETPLSIAEQQKNTEMIELLKFYNEKKDEIINNENISDIQEQY